MATIAPNDLAPADFHFLSLANAELDFSSGPVETDDPVTIANAESHPWVAVEYPAVEEADAQDQAAGVEVVHPLAIESGLNQNEPVVIEDADGDQVAVTLAAADDAEATRPVATTDTSAFAFTNDEEPRN